MLPVTQHLELEVSCPTCLESYTVPLDAVEESQRLLEHYGPCGGMASYECPVPYLADLVSASVIAELQRAVRNLESNALVHGARAAWIDGEPPKEPAPDSARRGDIAQLAEPLKKVAAEAALASELARWEDDGGSP